MPLGHRIANSELANRSVPHSNHNGPLWAHGVTFPDLFVNSDPLAFCFLEVHQPVSFYTQRKLHDYFVHSEYLSTPQAACPYLFIYFGHPVRQNINRNAASVSLSLSSTPTVECYGGKWRHGENTYNYKLVNNTVLKSTCFLFLNFVFYLPPIPNLLLLYTENRSHQESKSLLCLVQTCWEPTSAPTLSFYLGSCPSPSQGQCLPVHWLPSSPPFLEPLSIQLVTFPFFCLFKLSLYPIFKSWSLFHWEKKSWPTLNAPLLLSDLRTTPPKNSGDRQSQSCMGDFTHLFPPSAEFNTVKSLLLSLFLMSRLFFLL